MAGTSTGRVENIVQIIGKDAASAEIDKAIRSLERLKKQAAGVDGGGAKQAASAFDRLKEKIKAAAAAMAPVAAGVAAVGFAAKKALDLGRAGAQFEDQLGLLRKGVKDFDGILESATQKTSGLINQRALVEGATVLKNFGIGLQDFDRISEQVAKTAVSTGKSTEFLLNSIATGVARGSPMILDNLGIQVRLSEANDRYAKSLGKTSNALTDAEKKTALMSEVLRKLEENNVNVSLQDSRTASIQRFDAAVSNAQLTLERFVSDGLVMWGESLGDVADGTKTLAGILDNTLHIALVGATDGTTAAADAARELAEAQERQARSARALAEAQALANVQAKAAADIRAGFALLDPEKGKEKKKKKRGGGRSRAGLFDDVDIRKEFFDARIAAEIAFADAFEALEQRQGEAVRERTEIVRTYEADLLEFRKTNADESLRLAEETAAKERAALIAGARGGAQVVRQGAELVGASKKELAFLDGLIQSAESIASFAVGDFVGGAGHALAAAAFFKAAGSGGPGAGRGGGAGGARGAAPRSRPITSATAPAEGGGTTVINFQGFAVGTAQQLGSELSGALGAVRGTGQDRAAAV